MNLQVLGAPTRSDAVLATLPGANDRLFVHLRSDVVVGAVGINRPREIRRLRKLLAERVSLHRAELAAEGFHF